MSEIRRGRIELLNKSERIVRLGELAISRSEHLGINDPLTHLYQYLDEGERAFVGIKEDLETDIAERLPKTPFVNYVDFEYFGRDFISIKDRVSMREMTINNLGTLSGNLFNSSVSAQEMERAEVEAEEADKLADWFVLADDGACLVFESLPIGKQQIAVSRIYQKTCDRGLRGCFVSLYNPTVEVFNDFRTMIGAETGKNELDILQKCYEFRSDAFIEDYVNYYDRALEKSTGLKSCFGLEIGDELHRNGIEKVKKQPGLTAVYSDVIKTISAGNGVFTDEINNICAQLGLKKYESRLGQPVTIDMARDLLSDVINLITGVIDRGDKDFLEKLAMPGSRQNIHQAISDFSVVAAIEGVRYISNACPEFMVGQQLQVSERDAMGVAFSIVGLEDFGTPKADTCRISNCPSRGESKNYPQKTIVGGCSICINCHKLFNQGKNPEEVYLSVE